MKKLWITLAILFWISWGPINWGATLGYYGTKYPPVRDHYSIATFGLITGVTFGPIGGLAVFISTHCYEHGFVWK
jgi:hypothetical protein